MLARVQAAGKLALHLFLQSDAIDIKGRIACELSSADELLLTEMMFNGVFNELSPEQSAAVLSCFVTDEKSNEMPKLTQASSGLKDRHVLGYFNDNLTLEKVLPYCFKKFRWSWFL